MDRIRNQLRRRICVALAAALVPGFLGLLCARGRAKPSADVSANANFGGLQVTQPTIDLGVIWADGQTVQRDYTLENRTQYPMAIESVTSDCGCTAAKTQSSEIEPGHKTKIVVTFSTPIPIDDQGGRFRRTINVVVRTNDGTREVPLALTGFVEPYQSLQASPLVLELKKTDAPIARTAVLHLKGPASMLAIIPRQLRVLPGENRRVLVEPSSKPQPDEIIAKDIEVVESEVGRPPSRGWNASITFAPDTASEGLTIRVIGDAQPPILTSPTSVILTDDPEGREAVVNIAGNSGIVPVFVSATTSLPLRLNGTSKSLPNGESRHLHIELAGPVTSDIAGTIEINVGSPSIASEEISIPVVILHTSDGSK